MEPLRTSFKHSLLAGRGTPSSVFLGDQRPFPKPLSPDVGSLIAGAVRPFVNSLLVLETILEEAMVRGVVWVEHAASPILFALLEGAHVTLPIRPSARAFAMHLVPHKASDVRAAVTPGKGALAVPFIVEHLAQVMVTSAEKEERPQNEGRPAGRWSWSEWGLSHRWRQNPADFMCRKLPPTLKAPAHKESSDVTMRKRLDGDTATAVVTSGEAR